MSVLQSSVYIIVVIKPINILSQKDSTNDSDMLTIIKDYLKEKYHKPGNVYLGLVHRLDRVVGGVMVFAKTSKAAARLSNDIRENKLHKTYLVVCHGKVNAKGTLKDYLKKESDFKSVITTKEEGKLAVLDYKLLDYNQEMNLSLVKVNLITGRHHQIRCQFKNINHSLVGDKRYGNDNYQSIGLFAYQLRFIHPVKKEEMSFTYLPDFMPFNIFNLEKIIK